MQKTKKRKLIPIVAGTLAVVATLGAVGCDNQKNNVYTPEDVRLENPLEETLETTPMENPLEETLETTPMENPLEETLEITPGTSEKIILVMSEASVQEENCLSKIITATVLPEDAPDKTVDWSVEWLENNEGESAVVTDYVTVTASADGSNVATIKAFKSFFNSQIKVICTTRVGKYSTFATVKYNGVPTGIEMTYNSSYQIDDGYTLRLRTNADENNSFYIGFKSQNIFGNAGADYQSFEIMNVTYDGFFSIMDPKYGYQNHVFNAFGIDNYQDYDTENKAGFVLLVPYEELITTSWEGSNLTVTAIGDLRGNFKTYTAFKDTPGQEIKEVITFVDRAETPIEQVKEKIQALKPEFDTVNEIENGEITSPSNGQYDVKIKITVREKKTGVSACFRVGTYNDELTVTLDNAEIIF